MMPTRRKTLTQPWSTMTEPRTWTLPIWLTWLIKQVRPRMRGKWVVRWSSGRGKAWLILLNPPAWQLCTSKRVTTVNAGSFVRRPLKWGAKTGKTIDRLPSMLDLLEYFEWCGGFIVQDLNFCAWGGGLLGTEPALLTMGWKEAGGVKTKVCWWCLVSGCRCFSLQWLALVSALPLANSFPSCLGQSICSNWQFLLQRRKVQGCHPFLQQVSGRTPNTRCTQEMPTGR